MKISSFTGPSSGFPDHGDQAINIAASQSEGHGFKSLCRSTSPVGHNLFSKMMNVVASTVNEIKDKG